jgi:hypothetical protein
MDTIKKIACLACVALLAALAGCVRKAEVPAPPQNGLVPIELVPVTGGVEVTRATGIDFSATNITSATIIVFHATEDKVLQRRHLADVTTEKIYLKAGETYRVFAVANLLNGNCPNGDAATYFDDVDQIADLNGKYYIATAPAGTAPALMPMTSVDNTDATSSVATVTVSKGVPPALGETEVTVPIKMRSLYTKVAVTIYNRTNSSGANLSGLTFSDYLTENLPKSSWIVERPLADVVYDSDTETWSENSTAAGYDYPQSPPTPLVAPAWADYQATELTDISSGWTTTPVQLGGDYYVSRSMDIYTLENRRGIVPGVSANMHERKALAPAQALQVTVIGTLNSKTFYTYVLIGKGRKEETPPGRPWGYYDLWWGNYNVDRNCIYHVNLYINATDDVTQDSRREYLDVVVVQNSLVDPENSGVVIELKEP